jgi:hypothetical protein
MTPFQPLITFSNVISVSSSVPEYVTIVSAFHTLHSGHCWFLNIISLLSTAAFHFDID